MLRNISKDSIEFLTFDASSVTRQQQTHDMGASSAAAYCGHVLDSLLSCDAVSIKAKNICICFAAASYKWCCAIAMMLSGQRQGPYLQPAVLTATALRVMLTTLQQQEVHL